MRSYKVGSTPESQTKRWHSPGRSECHRLHRGGTPRSLGWTPNDIPKPPNDIPKPPTFATSAAMRACKIGGTPDSQTKFRSGLAGSPRSDCDRFTAGSAATDPRRTPNPIPKPPNDIPKPANP